MTEPMENEATKPQVAIPEDLLEEYKHEVGHSYASAAITRELKPTFVQTLIERIAAQSAELEQLRAQNARLKAPVSKREWADALTFAPSIYITDVERATRIIKDRAHEPQKESNDAE